MQGRISHLAIKLMLRVWCKVEFHTWLFGIYR